MSIKEVPKSYHYSCDASSCGTGHTQENASGHYMNSRPEGWLKITVYSDHRPGGSDVLLCPRCSIKMDRAVQEILS